MTTTQQKPTAWPENVIARYLTVGSASVDLTAGRQQYISTCSGCNATDTDFYRCGTYTYASEYIELDTAVDDSQTQERARNWAQAHAETCRAMPKPTT